MASSSSTSAPSLNTQVTEKLTRDNFILWRAQVLPQIRGVGYFGYLDGSIAKPDEKLVSTDKEGKEVAVPNPAYAIWLSQDQVVLGYLLNSLSKEALISVAALESAQEVWKALGNMFASASRARINNLRSSLVNAQKGSQTAAAFFIRMRSYADELAMAGKPVTDDELVSFITSGLDMEYNPLVSALENRTEPITPDELFGQLSNFDQRLERLQGAGSNGFRSSANAAARGHGGHPSRGRGNGGRGGQGRGGRPFYNNPRGAHRQGGQGVARGGQGAARGNGGGTQGTNGEDQSIQQCQICKKYGKHTTSECWWRYEDDDHHQQGEHMAGSAYTNPYGIDTNWYADSGATDHITSELERLTHHDKYRGQEQVHTAGGTGPSHEENNIPRQM
ncbi:hypothetical protein D1007_57977 [Hordeum vulgare]|nr:hypothetical protein D1007_57977 [Hordeum vulgare]